MNKTQKRIVDKYITFVLENDRKPISIHQFVEGLKIKEGTFYTYFSSFEQLEEEIWNFIFEETVKKIESQDVYTSYTVNEKLLAFYYTWIEELKDYRSFAIHTIHDEKIYELYPASFDLFKEHFENYVSKLIEEGLATQEIAERPFITSKYKSLLWIQPVSIIKFWVKDESKNFENTDALIEKTVHFSFDLMASNGFDSFFDLAKFHIQH